MIINLLRFRINIFIWYKDRLVWGGKYSYLPPADWIESNLIFNRDLSK